MEKLKRDIIRHILIWHKNLNEHDLHLRDVVELLSYTHPNDREEFEQRYNKLV